MLRSSQLLDQEDNWTYAVKMRSTEDITRETITDKSLLMECWLERYSDCSRWYEFCVTLCHWPHWEASHIAGVRWRSHQRQFWRHHLARPQDGIPAEVFKCGGSQLLDTLYQLLCKCWEERSVPQEMRDSAITTLYKNKGDRKNYRGISLLCIAGKLFARVALHRLQQLAERIYPESQCGFRSKRSTVDMIFSLRQIQEKYREQQQPLFIAVIDLTKAFDLVSRDGLFKILPLIGCLPKLISFIKSFHDGTRGTVQ